jgi:hypothetical protein
MNFETYERFMLSPLIDYLTDEEKSYENFMQTNATAYYDNSMNELDENLSKRIVPGLLNHLV